MKKNIILLVVFLILVACATVPIIGRRSLNIIPASTLNSMSFQQYNDFMKTHPKSIVKKDVAMINRVGNNIKNGVEDYFRQNGMADKIKEFNWEFNLIESDEVNAWCMPGGKVVFYSGILSLMDNEAQVAVVMGHEMGHAVAGHGNERMSHGLLAQLGGMLLMEALEKKPEETKQLWMGAYGLGAQFGALLPFSRLHEYEADKLGLIFMAMAGYDPHEGIDFWQKMAELKNGQAPPEFASTHPSDQNRIAKIQEIMPEVMSYYKK